MSRRSKFSVIGLILGSVMVFATLAAWGVDEEPILEIGVFADAIDFTLAHAEISALHLQVFDVEN